MDNYKEYLDPKDGYALVKSSIDMPVHPDWIEIPHGAEFYMEMRVGLKVGCKFFFKFDDEDLRVLSGSGWQHASYDSIQEYVDEGDQLLWSRETVKKDPALISGVEALRALADGKDVDVHESTYKNEVWFNLKDTKFTPAEILAEKVRGKPYTLTFRLKPQTIKLELEFPKPFEPEEDCHVYILDDGKTDGYRRYSYEVHGDKGNTFIGIWRTEEEIKQVVEQLRKIRGTNS